jgi:hypothetical protein
VGLDTVSLIQKVCKLPVQCDMFDPDQQFTSNIFHGHIHEQRCFPWPHTVLNNTLHADVPECINKVEWLDMHKKFS